jgi:hypothetical protein
MTESIAEKANSFGLALMILAAIATLTVPLMVVVGGPSSDSAGYHEGRVFAITETSGAVIFIALGMVVVGSVLYFSTRKRVKRAPA